MFVPVLTCVIICACLHDDDDGLLKRLAGTCSILYTIKRFVSRRLVGLFKRQRIVSSKDDFCTLCVVVIVFCSNCTG